MGAPRRHATWAPRCYLHPEFSPAEEEQAIDTTTEQNDERGAPRKLRIVVIEDNVDAAELLQMLFEMMGHEVDTAHDGAEGVALAKRTTPDVLLSDIGLPGTLDGYEVARTLRGDPSLAGTFLIALTGYGQLDDRQRATDAGFDAHLVKPADFETMRELLARVPPRT